MDVLFADVPWDLFTPQPGWCLGHRSMIACLRNDGFSAELLYPPPAGDGSARRRLIARIIESDAGIVGFTTYDAHLPSLLSFVSDLRRAGCRSHLCLGGFAASAVAGSLLRAHPSVDSVVVGEGEGSIVELARHLLRGGPLPSAGVWMRDGATLLAGAARPLMEDLDELPPPSLGDLGSEDRPLPLGNGCVPVVASRGCYGRCSFCSVQRFYRSCPGDAWRGRGPKPVVDEISRLTDQTGSRMVTFVDENFMGPGRRGRRHAKDIAQELQRRLLGVRFNVACRANDVDRETMQELKSAGLAAVTLGIESMHADTLRLFNKALTPEVNQRAIDILTSLGLYVEITFIFFHPLSTLEEVRHNLAFVESVRRSPLAYFSNDQPFTELQPFAGTPLTGRLEEQGLAAAGQRGYTTTCADPRVGLLARLMLSVPVEHLSRLRALLPAGGGGRVAEIRETLAQHRAQVTMARLPSLAAELCDAFESGCPVSSLRVRSVMREVERETDTIVDVVDRFAAHVA